MSEVWSACVTQLRGKVSVEDLNSWIVPLHPIQRDDTLRLLAPNQYILKHVQGTFMPLIESVVLQQNVGINAVRVEMGDHTAAATRPPTNGGVSPYSASPMDAGHTFDLHVEGSSNQIARAAAMAVGMDPGNAHNPLFIYGDVGLGKTHLMQAAGHLMRHHKPHAKVAYVHSEHFVSQMIKAIKTKEMHGFKRHYRSLDALLIDDVQFFARKDASQEEFFHTFNALLDAQHQIIVTSDRIPNAIAVPQRLISRLGSGLAICIGPPELETRVAILQKRATERGFELSDDVSFFIANAMRSNVRSLIGALHRVLAGAGFSTRPLDVDFAREMMGDMLDHQRQQISVENIQQAVSEYYRLRGGDLLSRQRSRRVARPRQLAMYFVKEYTDLSLPQIGERFGGRDHTTVLHACRRITQLLSSDAKMKEDHRTLQRAFDI